MGLFGGIGKAVSKAVSPISKAIGGTPLGGLAGMFGKVGLGDAVKIAVAGPIGAVALGSDAARKNLELGFGAAMGIAGQKLGSTVAGKVGAATAGTPLAGMGLESAVGGAVQNAVTGMGSSVMGRMGKTTVGKTQAASAGQAMQGLAGGAPAQYATTQFNEQVSGGGVLSSEQPTASKISLPLIIGGILVVGFLLRK